MLCRKTIIKMFKMWTKAKRLPRTKESECFPFKHSWAKKSERLAQEGLHMSPCFQSRWCQDATGTWYVGHHTQSPLVKPTFVSVVFPEMAWGEESQRVGELASERESTRAQRLSPPAVQRPAEHPGRDDTPSTRCQPPEERHSREHGSFCPTGATQYPN